jgi:hypothetical protein
MDWAATKDSIIRAGIATFGECVEYHAQLNVPIEVRAIFDAAYQEVDPQTGVAIGSAMPAIDVRIADLPTTPSPGDKVSARGNLYRVVSYQPDGQGAARLVLHKL